MMKIVLLAATTILVFAGCGSGSGESEAPEIAAPATTEVDVAEHEIVVGEPFTINSPHYVAHVTVTDVFRPETCGPVPYTDVEYDTFIGIEMDVEVKSGDGEGFVPNGVNERTEDGYVQKSRSLSAVNCEGYEELSATRVKTGEKYRGVLWLQEDVDPSSEIILEPHVSAQEPVVTEVYVLDLSEFDLSGEAEVAEPTTGPAPEAAPAPAPAPAAAAPAAAPTFVECQLADGTALMSDGTTTYMDTCNESAGGPYLLEDGSPAITYSPEDLADASYWSNCIEAGNTSEYCTANDPN
ncbi:hypothetical protein [Dietzia kunjamensis]|uniref:hypothetical protein n=1 Tax=Dietzia kunjamensis TaxID=322509 RepID=UPI0020971D2C|nr:hypothetical protein [Dietzia kunjamensis]USX46803.1 hypothetical protein NHB83_04865 [Dietzia kunjamensis]